MKPVGRLLTVVSLCVLTGSSYAMTIERMKMLRGTDLLELRVADIFSRCGLPDAIIDRGMNTSTSRDIQWKNIKMQLSDGSWDLRYGNGDDSRPINVEKGWINPSPAESACFSGLSHVTLFSQGRAGILTIDKKRRKTTYVIPNDLLIGQKVIGYEASLTAPWPFEEWMNTFGRGYETVQENMSSQIIRYWVVVESGQMPIAVYAVDLEIDRVRGACVAYRVATSDYDFVRLKFHELTKAWEKYGID